MGLFKARPEIPPARIGVAEAHSDDSAKNFRRNRFVRGNIAGQCEYRVGNPQGGVEFAVGEPDEG